MKLKNDYSFVYQYKINRFYIDNKVTGLIKKFKQLEASIKQYKKNKLKKLKKIIYLL